ncbi:Uncharacterized protein TCAP_05949 [Tolypocladium capitatum]|uniref:Uncharacterized protein n=1 Tax=Tolypocladium capitatum TaxID=45235 RepID=A0A2K3Q9H8_9HYPO|nr:Uncharacterized protein TCAP_05949 [Tolypocladium capitatum]
MDRDVKQEVPEGGGKERKQKDGASVEDAEKNDAWAKAKAQGPSENWQPAAWSPSWAKKR